MISTYFTDTVTANISIPGAVSNLAVTSLAGGGVAALGNDGSGNIAGAIFDANGVQTGSFTAQGSNGSIAQLTNGNLVILSQAGGNIYTKIVDASGALVEDTFIRAIGQASNSSLIGLSDGGFMFFYSSDAGGGNTQLTLYKASSNGDTLDADLTAGTAFDFGVSAAQMSDGNIALAWTRTNGANTEIWTAIRDSSGFNWTVLPAVFDNIGTINRNVSLTATATGFAIAYEGNGGDGTDIKIASLDFVANQIASATIGAPGNDEKPVLTELADGSLGLVFENNAYADTDVLFGLISPGLSGIPINSQGSVFLKAATR